jgi:hypothetical protein
MSIAYRTLLSNKSIASDKVYIITGTNNVAAGIGSPLDKFDRNGNIIDTLSTQIFKKLKTDNLGNIYAVNGSSPQQIRKYDKDFNLIWGVDYGANSLNSIEVDKNGNVLAAGGTVNTVTTRKYNSSGTLLWSVNHGEGVIDITTDSSGNVYTGGVVSALGGVNRTTRKYNSSGVLQWSVNHGVNVNAIAVDSSGNVYTGGGVTGNLTTRKYNSSGSLIWSRNHIRSVNGIAVDAVGNVFTVGQRTDTLIGIRKYSTSGTLLWSAISPNNGDSEVALDTSDDIYVVGLRYLLKFNQSGTQLWQRETSINSGMICLATFPPTLSQWL